MRQLLVEDVPPQNLVEPRPCVRLALFATDLKETDRRSSSRRARLPVCCVADRQRAPPTGSTTLVAQRVHSRAVGNLPCSTHSSPGPHCANAPAVNPESFSSTARNSCVPLALSATCPWVLKSRKQKFRCASGITDIGHSAALRRPRQMNSPDQRASSGSRCSAWVRLCHGTAAGTA